MTFIRRLFRRQDPPHLWRNPVTGLFHDPRVLLRRIHALPSPLDARALRDPLLMGELVTPDGRGYAESQVEGAYEAFLGWLAGKERTARTSPTSAPSTDSPAA